MNQPSWKHATGGNGEQKPSGVLGGSPTHGWGKGNRAPHANSAEVGVTAASRWAIILKGALDSCFSLDLRFFTFKMV